MSHVRLRFAFEMWDVGWAVVGGVLVLSPRPSPPLFFSLPRPPPQLCSHLVQMELARGPLEAFDADARDRGLRVQGDEELLPFRHNVYDVVLSNLALHWVRFLFCTQLY